MGCHLDNACNLVRGILQKVSTVFSQRIAKAVLFNDLKGNMVQANYTCVKVEVDVGCQRIV